MAQPAPTSPAPKPASPTDAALPGPEGTLAKRTPLSALFHTLLEAGFDAPLAYTAETHVNTMSSQAAATQVQPLIAEMRQMRQTMATRADLADVATTGDLARLEIRMVKWMFGALVAQAAFIIAVIKLLG